MRRIRLIVLAEAPAGKSGFRLRRDARQHLHMAALMRSLGALWGARLRGQSLRIARRSVEVSRASLASLFAWAAARGAPEDTPPGLEGLAVAVKCALAPVEPSAEFRRALRRDLAAMARQKKAPRIILQQPPNHRRGIIIGAAVSSVVSVAGLIAIIWRRHTQVAQRAM